MSEINEIVAFLMDPARLWASVETTQLVTTEESWIVLVGEEAFKVRRPVQFDARDFSTLEAREKACQRELRLNKRLGGDIYLGAVPIFRSETGLTLDGPGEVVDTVIRMKRLPADRMLNVLCENGGPGLTDAEVDSLADLFAEFYSSAKSASRSCRAGTRADLEQKISLSIKAIGEYLPDDARVDAIESALRLYIASHEQRLTKRISQGRIRDGHGALRSDHICMVEPPIAIGCVETRDKERQADVLFDIASLFVDLDLRGGKELSTRIWKKLSGRLNEIEDDPLLRFYAAIRAIMAARLEAIRPSQSDSVRKRCETLLDYALQECHAFQKPRLFVMVGLIGTGKTSLAQALANDFGLTRVSSESIRQILYSDVPNGKPMANRLDPDQSEQVFDAMMTQAKSLLEKGVSVVLDAGFLQRKFRLGALALAEEVQATPLFLECRLAKSEALTRLSNRFKKNRTNRGLRPEIYEEQEEIYDPPEELHDEMIRVVNTNLPVPDLVETIRESL